MLHGHSLRTVITMTDGAGLVSLVWIMAMLYAVTCATPITCEAGACTVGEKTTVNCNFNEDICASKRGFNVVQYPFNASRDDFGTVILACVWPESGKPVCSVEDGFSFNYKIKDRLTLEIPSATEKVAGVYACSRVPTDNIPVRPCSLIVEDVAGEPETKELPGLETGTDQAGTLKTTGEPTLSTTIRSQKTNPYSHTGSPQESFETAFFFLLAILILTAVLLVVMAVCLRKAYIAQKRMSRERFQDAYCDKGITTVVWETPAGSSNGAERSEKRYDDSPAVESATPMLIEDGLPSATSKLERPSCSDSGNISHRAEDGSVDVHQLGLQICVAGS